MSLNKVRGNMYNFCTHTWNAIKGKCPHFCGYCFMKRFGEQKPIRFDKKELKTDLGKGNFIFVGSSCDMFAEEIDTHWIAEILMHCKQFPNNYLFQTKNPKRLYELRVYLSRRYMCGTTIETNREYPEMGNTPPPASRAKYMELLSATKTTMVTIEPVMDFDVEPLKNLIWHCHPKWVNIGADSKGHNLPEPSAGKIKELINRLSKFTEIKVKKNLNRIWNEYPKG